jgi:hypothetical protein
VPSTTPDRAGSPGDLYVRWLERLSYALLFAIIVARWLGLRFGSNLPEFVTVLCVAIGGSVILVSGIPNLLRPFRKQPVSSPLAAISFLGAALVLLPTLWR